MSELLSLESGQYVAPENAEDFGERDIDGKRLILYIGEKATVDVVERRIKDDHEELGRLLLRVVADKSKAMDLLNHTPLFATPEEANRVFGRVGLTDEELESSYSNAQAAA